MYIYIYSNDSHISYKIRDIFSMIFSIKMIIGIGNLMCRSRNEIEEGGGWNLPFAGRINLANFVVSWRPYVATFGVLDPSNWAVLWRSLGIYDPRGSSRLSSSLPTPDSPLFLSPSLDPIKPLGKRNVPLLIYLRFQSSEGGRIIYAAPVRSSSLEWSRTPRSY